MKLDIAMGGSTNTVLHLLAIAHEAGVDFSMHDIDQLSRVTPNLCKVAPSSAYHVQDVNRAGGFWGSSPNWTGVASSTPLCGESTDSPWPKPFPVTISCSPTRGRRC